MLALDPATAAGLLGLADVIQPAGAPGALDAVAGFAAPERVPDLLGLLRPGGRLILAAAGPPEALLDALESAGCIHCLVEPLDAPSLAGFMLYRGERPPLGGSLARHQALAEPAAHPDLLAGQHAIPGHLRHLFLLVSQSPNAPAWRLPPDAVLEWQAATVLPPGDPRPHLLVFSSLVKAVALMQPAVLAGALTGINKIGKFPAAAASQWPLPMLLNVGFDALRQAQTGPPLPVDPRAAISGEE